LIYARNRNGGSNIYPADLLRFDIWDRLSL
jgi:hypothetical protein